MAPALHVNLQVARHFIVSSNSKSIFWEFVGDSKPRFSLSKRRLLDLEHPVLRLCCTYSKLFWNRFELGWVHAFCNVDVPPDPTPPVQNHAVPNEVISLPSRRLSTTSMQGTVELAYHPAKPRIAWLVV